MNARDYSETLFLPKTDFPMRAGLPQKEPQLLARWHQLGLYERLRAAAAGLPKFILHDGPPYANGNIHIGHALNKILKDVVTRSQQMLGFDSNYVPGWDCHGLPIEWKIEEEYRAKGKNKDAVPLVEFRRECRAFAAHWVEVQREEFKRLGVEGDWAHPYSTMDFAAEAQIARELMKFAQNGTLYRGSKPVMWSVVEKTALAEAEVEYEDYVSDQVWVKFPVRTAPGPNQQAGGRRARHLDDDAVDHSRQPSDQLLAKNRVRTLRSGRRTRGKLGQAGRPVGAGRQARRGCVPAGTRHGASSDWVTFLPPIWRLWSATIRSKRSTRVTILPCHCSPATMSPTTPAPASCTPRPAMAARTSKSGPGMLRSLPRAASTPRSPTPSTPTAASPITRRASSASACSPTRATRATPTRP